MHKKQAKGAGAASRKPRGPSVATPADGATSVLTTKYNVCHTTHTRTHTHTHAHTHTYDTTDDALSRTHTHAHAALALVEEHRAEVPCDRYERGLLVEATSATT